MSEKKPLKPLLLFTISSALSFSAGVFTGVVLMPSFEEPSNSSEIISEINLEEELDRLDDETLNTEEQPEEEQQDKEENEALNRYKNMLKKSIDESVQNEEFFKSYGVIVGSYTNMEKANNTAIDLKSQYNWETAVYPMDNFYKVIVGPFENQKSAQKFLEQMPKISRFIAVKIIELPKK